MKRITNAAFACWRALKPIVARLVACPAFAFVVYLSPKNILPQWEWTTTQQQLGIVAANNTAGSEHMNPTSAIQWLLLLLRLIIVSRMRDRPATDEEKSTWNFEYASECWKHLLSVLFLLSSVTYTSQQTTTQRNIVFFWTNLNLFCRFC